MRIEPLQLHLLHTQFIDYDHRQLLHGEIGRLLDLHSSLDYLQLPLSARSSPHVTASARLNFADRHPLRDPG